jgi:hypothetical protein
MINAERFHNSYYNALIERAPQEQSLSFNFNSVQERCLSILEKTPSEFKLITTKGIKHFTMRQYHHLSTAGSTLLAYTLFGRDLLVPTTNSIKEEFLDEVFLEETNKKLNYPGEETLLEEHGFFFRGLCGSLSRQFIHDVLNVPEKERTPEKIKSIGEKFIDGGSKEIVEKQRRPIQLSQKNNPLNKEMTDKSIEEANEIMNNYNITKDIKINTNQTPSEMTPLNQKPSIERIKNTLNVISNDHSEEVPYGSNMKTKYGLSSIAIEKKKISKNTTVDQELENECSLTAFTTEQLTPGVYIIYSSSHKENKNNPSRAISHATAYIKSETGPNYLYEPLLGTVQIPKGKDVEYISYGLKLLNFDQLFLTQHKLLAVDQQTNTSSSL